MPSAKNISPGNPAITQFTMFTHYLDGSHRQRFFSSTVSCAAWQMTMRHLKVMGAVVDYHTFPLAFLPRGVVVTR